VNEDLLAMMRADDRLVPHLHLPLQSGSDAVLGRMRRQYSAADYDRTVRRVRASLDRPAITTDLIVGFPGETEEDFQATLGMARSAGFAGIHAFRFSPRPQTAAARWSDRFVGPRVVRERMARLSALAAELSLDYRRQFVGRNVRVIIELPDPRTPNWRRGRCERYFMVHFPMSCRSPLPPPARSPDHVGIEAGQGGPPPRADRVRVPRGAPDVHGRDVFACRLATVRIDSVTKSATVGTLISIDD
jgi:tRNA A37 methylthiotransferase MiaB